MRLLPKDYRAIGEKVYLRPISEEDTDMLLSWRNSPHVMENFFYRLPVSKEEHLDWLKNKVNKGIVYQYIVCMKNEDNPVGCVYLQHYDETDNSMESGVFLDEEAPKGQGIGTEAVNLLNYEVAFRELRLNKTIARVIDHNQGSLKLHTRVGFVEIKRDIEKLYPSGEEVVAVTFELTNPQMV